ncbi:transaldolase family protein [Streptomyces sp. NPDC050418]|uniref:transaldolase family protein n=1 Tax=Streptomyces sp. NPDC050418 TaxID=3365612 RepID=UPI0037919400
MNDARAADILAQLATEGVSPWLLCPQPEPSRAYFAALVRLGFRGAALPAGASPAAVRVICDELRTYHGGERAADGWVSVPVGPGADPEAEPEAETAPEALVAKTRALWASVDRPNVLLALPATDAGLAAAGQCLASGIRVELTGVRSPACYARALEAQLAGLESALTHGVALTEVLAAVSAPLGVLDAQVNDGLKRGDMDLLDAAGVSLARLLHGLRERRLGSAWWRVLRAAGAATPLLIWRDTLRHHVAGVVGWNTAHVLSEPTLAAAASSGPALRGDTLLGQGERARQAAHRLGELGLVSWDANEG